MEIIGQVLGLLWQLVSIVGQVLLWLILFGVFVVVVDKVNSAFAKPAAQQPAPPGPAARPRPAAHVPAAVSAQRRPQDEEEERRRQDASDAAFYDGVLFAHYFLDDDPPGHEDGFHEDGFHDGHDDDAAFHDDSGDW